MAHPRGRQAQAEDAQRRALDDATLAALRARPRARKPAKCPAYTDEMCYAVRASATDGPVPKCEHRAWPADVRPLIALDMATATGWAVRKPDGTVLHGAKAFPRARGETEGAQFMRFRAFVGSLLVMCDAPGPRPLIAFERPHQRGGAATDLAAGWRAVVLEEQAKHGLEVMTVASSTLKKHATGCGKAHAGKIKDAKARRAEMKAAMKRAAARRWKLEHEPESDDEADALCVLSWVLEQIGETT